MQYSLLAGTRPYSLLLIGLGFFPKKLSASHKRILWSQHEKSPEPPNFEYNAKFKRFTCLFTEITEKAPGITKHTGEKALNLDFQ